jgi:hypothetical protein
MRLAFLAMSTKALHMANKYGIQPNMFCRRQKQFFENDERAFRNQKEAKTKLLENKVSSWSTS